MKPLERKILCSHGSDMLGYLYNEISTADRETFELHLADCGTCIDDFAELSQSRYPVYEWKQIDFDPLETPQIAISYQPRPVQVSDWITTLLAFGRAFGSASAAALVLIAFAVGYFLFVRAGSRDQIAQTSTPSPSPRSVAVEPDPVKVPVERKSVVGEVAEDEQVKTETESRRPRLTRASTRQPSQTARPNRSKKPFAKRTVPIPVLSTAEDFEDDSLRLADLFEEIETSE